MTTDCQMQPLDLSCPESRMRRLRHSSSDSAVGTPTPVTPPASATPPRERSGHSSGSEDEAPRAGDISQKAISIVEAALGSLGGGVGGGPARKRFLTKYLHKDRGESGIPTD